MVKGLVVVQVPEDLSLIPSTTNRKKKRKINKKDG
jgi:hypothetical protein